jgi:pseudaminic acid biosynthesis-associated methylase
MDLKLNDQSRETPLTSQLAAWTGQFGDDYVERNDYSQWKLACGIEGFRRMLGGLTIASVLEVGSNIGLKLLFIDRLFQGRLKLFAVEPNGKAFARLTAQEHFKLAGAWRADAFGLPLPDACMDLVFTSGVLIHISPDDLGRATDEINRVARKYLLCVEYFSHTPVEVPYRGHQGLLFKRDFGTFYQDRYPHLQCLNYGFLWKRELPVFDNLNWWLFEKPEVDLAVPQELG